MLKILLQRHLQKEIPYIIKYGFNVGKYFRDRSKLIPYSNHTTPQQLFLQSSRGFVKLNTETLKKKSALFGDTHC